MTFFMKNNLLITYNIDSPSPDSYRLNSEFDPNASGSKMAKSKAFTFGASREAYDKVYVPS